ncbi:unnamed protein product [Heterobilharzia americana]|nr:unnamed protein product [Heterobilharzia americana]
MDYTKSQSNYNNFAYDLLETSVSPIGDYLSSPLSAFLLLTTLFGSGGVKGNTQVQIGDVLGIDNVKGKQKIATQLFTSLYHNLTEENVNEINMIKIGNAVFLKDGAKIKSTFSTKLIKQFDSNVFNVDFTLQEDAKRTINGWVSNKTNKLIPEFLKQSLSKQTILALVNTLYFKGRWKKPFSKRSTADRDFKPANQPVIKVPMMYITETMDYGKFPHFRVHMISKQFSNPRFTFVVILPIETGNIEFAEEVLRGYVQLPILMKQLQPTEISLDYQDSN